jgi:transposase-like protein/ribosomal protein L37AE/L43A
MASNSTPQPGKHYPTTYGKFGAWFQKDADCLDYLEWVRWPEGFVCPDCESTEGWRLNDGRYKCGECGARTSPTAGTIFDRTRTPLTVWFHVCWTFATQKDGISALALQRNHGLGSYQTAWAMLHRLRSVLVRPGRELLSGTVEVDETFIGGSAPGDQGGRTPDEKALVAVAVERIKPKGFGRCRMVVIKNATTTSLRTFLKDNVAPGSTVITDGWQPYLGATADIYTHQRHVAPGALAHQLLPGVHRVSALAKRWILGTHQGSMGDAHLQLYLNEFVFRWNRRKSRNLGLRFWRLLELAASHDPVRYHQLIKTKRPSKMPRPPPKTRGKPASMEQSGIDRPWRTPSTD